MTMMMAATCVALLGGMGWSSMAAGQEVAGPTPEFVGRTGCTSCHDRPKDVALSIGLVRLNEATLFLEHDRHTLAFDVLRGPLGQQMGRRLWNNPDVTGRRECLSCHSNWLPAQPAPPLEHDLGVSCESCHGPSSLWDLPHRQTAWRTKTPAEKAALGMVEVRAPLARARQCFKCHVGDIGEGKFVTHAMYAAGHPPLPGIEIESFAGRMPTHWRYLREKGDFEHREEFVRVNGLADAGDDLPRTRAVLVGGLAALQQLARLYAAQTDPGVVDHQPDFALFNCASCHHDLRSPATAVIARGSRGARPGRPPPHAWPLALVDVGVAQLAGGDDARRAELQQSIDQSLDALIAALTDRPFGDRAAVHHAAAALDAELETLLVELSRSRFDAAAARRALAVLTDTPLEHVADFHAARQVAWAVQVIAAELATPYPSGFSSIPENETRPERRARELADLALVDEWRDTVRQAGAEHIGQWLDRRELRARLLLEPPRGLQVDYAELATPLLRAAREYDPRWFRARLAELHAEPPTGP